MRGMTIGPWLVAGILLLLSAVPAAMSATEPEEASAVANRCETNNNQVEFSCFQLGDGTEPTIYVDTGRADNWAGIWQETNKHPGLQKDEFRMNQETQSPDKELTALA